jgi:hypothetical protein
MYFGAVERGFSFSAAAMNEPDTLLTQRGKFHILLPLTRVPFSPLGQTPQTTKVFEKSTETRSEGGEKR